MKAIVFIDDTHQKFYEECIERTSSHKDPYRKALFYTLGLTNETRRNIDRLYNFEERCIEFDGLFDGWQTGASIKATRLAFNLYSGFNGETYGEKDDDPDEYNPYSLFCTSLSPYFFEAIKLRYPEYNIKM